MLNKQQRGPFKTAQREKAMRETTKRNLQRINRAGRGNYEELSFGTTEQGEERGKHLCLAGLSTAD